MDDAQNTQTLVRTSPSKIRELLSKVATASECRSPSASSANELGLKWLKFPLDMWIPAGLADFQIGWFMNLLRASLYSDSVGYLILCPEGCSGCPACLWKIAGAHRSDYFEKRKSLVLARFEFAQIAGRRVAYYPPLVRMIKQQLSRMKNHRSQYDAVSETSTVFNKGSGFPSPSETLCFDFDSDSKNQNQNINNTREASAVTKPEGEQNLDKNIESGNSEFEECPKRILNVLGLPDTFLAAATAAVEAEAKRGKSSADGIVQTIWTAATLARHGGIGNAEFLQDFLARSCAREILESTNLSNNNNFIQRVAAVLKAEAKDTGLSLQDAASRITQAASEDRQKGMRIDIFYFEDVKWRSNVGVNKAERRKLGNLAANTRAKEILRKQFQ
jgi:hypothetical protein